MIRIDAIWLATVPIDMRAGTETALTGVIPGFGAAKQHCDPRRPFEFVGVPNIVLIDRGNEVIAFELNIADQMEKLREAPPKGPVAGSSTTPGRGQPHTPRTKSGCRPWTG